METPAPMPAVELHALVNGRYAMPDGSKRRALWARVLATRPDLLHFLRGCVDEGCECGLVSSWEYNGSRVGKDSVEESPDGTAVASALIRVAIEDWLRTQCCDGGITLWSQTYAGPEQKVELVGDFPDAAIEAGREKQGYFYGPTIMHALVSTAHHVADALGVPH